MCICDPGHSLSAVLTSVSIAGTLVGQLTFLQFVSIQLKNLFPNHIVSDVRIYIVFTISIVDFQDLRASTKKKDDTLLEVTGLREDAKHRTIQVESLAHEMIRKQEELDRVSRALSDKSNKFDEKERVS